MAIFNINKKNLKHSYFPFTIKATQVDLIEEKKKIPDLSYYEITEIIF